MKNTTQRWRKINRRQNRRRCSSGSDNRGFSLFTVMIAVSFIGILGMLLLYIALANFQMKTTDLKGKDSFYTAERALEEIRVGLQQDVGNAMAKAYVITMETYDTKIDNPSDPQFTTTPGMPSLDKQREDSFKKLYIDELETVLQDQNRGEGFYSMGKLRGNGTQEDYGYVDLYQSLDASETLVITNPDGMDPVMEFQEDSILLKNLKVIYVDKKGRASIIETDLRLGMPKIQYPTPSTLPDLMNMIVVADGGIVCEGDYTSNNIIEGSVYAGNIGKDDPALTSVLPEIYNDTSILLRNGASLTVKKGDKLVCEGEVYVSDGATFDCESEVTLWAQGLSLTSANVTLSGKTYLADDLTVESGTGSNVTISGEYYGYGSRDSAKACKDSDRYEQLADAAQNSAIVINGKNTTLDLSQVKRIMLAGRSYVGSTKVKGFARDNQEFKNQKNDVLTGESITVKGTQVAYLLPAKLLKAKVEGTELHNPMDYDEYKTKLADVQNEDLKSILYMDMPVEEWGGENLSQIGVDTKNPVTRVFYNNQSNNGYIYFYLNFTDSKDASYFMTQYYQNVKENMDKYLSFYFPWDESNSRGNSGIRINETDSLLRYVTNGNVLIYDGQTKTGALKEATDSVASSDFKQEQIDYQNMWYSLKRKMIGSYDLLKTDGQDADGVPHNEEDGSVYDNLVNEKEMVKFIIEQQEAGQVDPSDTWKYPFEEDSAIIYHNGKVTSYLDNPENSAVITVPGANREFVITADMVDKLRLVVCTGDVRILKNVHFQGIIMAKGKITLEEGASLTSMPEEAAVVFQHLNEKAGASSKEIFWEGNSYVLGNTTTTENTTTGNISDTYDISQSVTYENWKKR